MSDHKKSFILRRQFFLLVLHLTVTGHHYADRRRQFLLLVLHLMQIVSKRLTMTV